MRIKTFCKLVERESFVHRLKDCDVVIDGQSFFYNLYEESKLPFAFGCESDRFAKFLREYLGMFKKANVKCYFVFKGGSKDIERKLIKKTDRYSAKDYDPRTENNEIILPIFVKQVYKQVLDEMGFDYVVCEFEAKKQCVALAQTLNCLLISNDIEISFSKVPYVLHNSLYFNPSNDTIECRIFHLNHFLDTYLLTEEHVAIFIVLTDIHIFPENFFIDFIKKLRIPLSNYTRNEKLLEWLSKRTREQAVEEIFNCIPHQCQEEFLEKEKEVIDFIGRNEALGVPVEFFLNGNRAPVFKNDPLWFEKGIADGYIAIPYIDLYHSNILQSSWAIEDPEENDASLLSLDIVKYAYNLMTNYNKREFKLYTDNGDIIDLNTECGEISKPNYEAKNNVFENGWNLIRVERLFEHFLKETMHGFDLQRIENLPKDARLLMISLIYFSFKKSENTSNEVCSILMSYIMLGVISEVKQNPLWESDCNTASEVLKEYFELKQEELIDIFDRKIIHSLVEFQHCLQHMNYLNALCGFPYKPTIYHKTYNGTFVYKTLYASIKRNKSDGLNFFKQVLESAPNVFNHFNMLLNEHKHMMLSIGSH